MGRDTERRPFPDGQTIYHQLRWDPRFDAGACEIVLADRPAGTKVIAFRDFLPNGPIPWHRIVGFRYRGDVLWDRTARVDRRDQILASGPDRPGAASSLARLPERAARVSPAPGASVALTEHPSVLTWNVLAETWGAPGDHPARWRALLQTVEARSAELMVFTEATAAFRAEVEASSLSLSHVRVASEHGDVLVLARATPRSSVVVELAPGREAIVCAFDELQLVGLHLPSDRESSRRAERERDLHRLTTMLLDTRTLVLAGDLNAQDAELDRFLEAVKGVDAWSHLRPDEPGLTYDVAANPLTATLTKRGRSGRLDRVLLVGGTLAPTRAHLVGAGGAPVSDHFGVEVTLQDRERLTSHRTALVLLPPEAAWGPVQRLRRAFDDRFDRWPPHVTLLYGFVPPADLDDAVERLSQAARQVEPFSLRLDQRLRFEHARSHTAALGTESEPLRALQRTVQAAFPLCREQNRGEGGGFTPHLTLGRGAPETVTRLEQSARGLSLEWRVDQLAVLERPQEVFLVRERIELGSGLRVPRTRPITATDELEATVRAAITECAALTNQPVEVERFGSRAYAPTLPGADLDLHVTVSGSATTLADLLHQRLEGSRLVPPSVVRGERYDVVLVEDTAKDEGSERLRLGVADARALRLALERHGRAEAFDAAFPLLRQWTKRRALEGNAWGYFGGLGWAVLLATPLLHDPVLCATPAAEVWPAWRAWAARRTAHDDVSLEHGLRTAEVFAIASPAEPRRDITRALIESTTRTLLEELRAQRDGDSFSFDGLVTISGPEERAGDFQQRALAAFASAEREVGPVLRVFGEPVSRRGTRFHARVGCLETASADVSRLLTGFFQRAGLHEIRAFVAS